MRKNTAIATDTYKNLTNLSEKVKWKNWQKRDRKNNFQKCESEHVDEFSQCVHFRLVENYLKKSARAWIQGSHTSSCPCNSICCCLF